MDLTRKLLEQWKDDEALWRRYEELRLILRLATRNLILSEDEMDDWD